VTRPILIEAREVRRSYDGGTVQALRGVDLTILRGEFVSIMGPSGSGKSTLLNVLGALDAGIEGTITIDGADLCRLPDPERFRAHAIGFVFQSFHLLPTLTALENVQVPMFEMPWPRTERRARAVRLLDLLGLGARLHHLPSKLSGGERQRVAIARSLANEPKLLLADEPTGNLDSDSARRILDVLRSIHARGDTTIVVVTHDPGVAAQAERTLHMLDGRITTAPAPTAGRGEGGA
jgi:ABC-type lipoprotein export system ATPase subunit